MVWAWKSGYAGQRMLNLELLGRGKQGRPRKRFKDVMKEGIQRIGVTM